MFMKKSLILFLLVCMNKFSWSQNDLQKCVETSFRQTDSAYNPADALLIWRDCVKGKQVPEFSVKTMAGKKIKSKDMEGKIIVLNLWFIDCLPCIAELPALNKLVNAYKDNKEIVFLAITWESKARVENDFFSKYKLDFSIIPDAQTTVDSFGKPGYPATFIIDRRGVINTAWLGGPVGERAESEAYEKIKPVVDQLLKVR